MRTRMVLANVEVRRILIGCAVAAIAALTLTGPGAKATAPATVKVQIKSEWDVTGLRPDGTTVDFWIKAVAEGSDASSLVGGGRIFGSNHGQSDWSGSGAIVGDVVTLTGAVTDSNLGITGTPVTVVGNASTNSVTLIFGPFTAGRFAGETIEAEGPGNVTIQS